MAFSDTRVDDLSLIPSFKGYHDFQYTTTPTGAGGVGFFLKDSFDYELLPNLKLNLTLCEDIWLRVTNISNAKLNNKGLIIGVIYRHGHNCKNFYEKFSELLDSLNSRKEKYLIVGDFNLDLMKYNLATPNTDYLNALHSVGCNAFIDKPTRIKSGAATCLDHVYSNLDTGSIDNHIVLAEVSDHFGTLSKIEGITSESKKQKVFYRKSNLSEEKWAELDLYFQMTRNKIVPFPHLLNANSLSCGIRDIYDETINKFMPEKERTVNPNQKPDRPWMTTGLKASIAKMYELLRISKQSGLQEDNVKYKAHLNMLTSLKRKCKNNYFKELVRSYGKDRAKTWQLVNKITNFRRKSTTNIKCLVDKNGNHLTNPSDIANTLNNHFGSIGKNNSSRI